MVGPLVVERAYSGQISYHDFQNPGKNKRITFFLILFFFKTDLLVYGFIDVGRLC